MLTADLTRDGSAVFGKYRLWQLRTDWPSTPEERRSDKRFIQILDGRRKAEVLEKVVSCARAVGAASLLLDPKDPMELLIHPDGSYKCAIVDFKDIKSNTDPIYDPIYENLQAAGTFMQWLVEARERLRAQGTTNFFGSWAGRFKKLR
jgi:hypothetical protein